MSFFCGHCVFVRMESIFRSLLLCWSMFCIFCLVFFSILQLSSSSLTRRCRYSQRQSPLHFFVSLDAASNLRIFHLFHDFVCASFYVFNPVFFFSVSISNDTSLSWSLWVIELCPSSLSSSVLSKSFVFFSSLISSLRFTIFLSLLFCVYDEKWHLTLRRLHHSVVLFCGSPCAWCVKHRRSYHSVEMSESMFERVVSRCQFLSVLVERRLSSPDSISDFDRLLLLECNHLFQIFRVFSSFQYFEFYIICLNFFSGIRALITKNFRFLWMDPESHFV